MCATIRHWSARLILASAAALAITIPVSARAGGGGGDGGGGFGGWHVGARGGGGHRVNFRFRHGFAFHNRGFGFHNQFFAQRFFGQGFGSLPLGFGGLPFYDYGFPFLDYPTYSEEPVGPAAETAPSVVVIQVLPPDSGTSNRGHVALPPQIWHRDKDGDWREESAASTD